MGKTKRVVIDRVASLAQLLGLSALFMEQNWVLMIKIDVSIEGQARSVKVVFRGASGAES